MRYKPLHAGLEAVAWFCSSCGAEVHREEFDTEDELPQDAYWRARTRSMPTSSSDAVGRAALCTM